MANMDNMGSISYNHIYLSSGVRFDLANPKVEDIKIDDVIAALPMLTRFTGHSRPGSQAGMQYGLSVAQHCIHVAKYLADVHGPDHPLVFEGLMHDGHEVYIGDVSTPLKRLCPDIAEVEKRVQTCFRKAFGLPEEMSPEVREADYACLLSEASMLGLFGPPVAKVRYTWKPYSPARARRKFCEWLDGCYRP